MARKGYGRVSKENQHLERQIEALGHIDKLYIEKVSGKAGKKRPELEKMIENLAEGDEVVVHAIDRIGRSISDFMKIVERIRAKKASLSIINIKMRFDESPFVNAIIQVLMVFAELELAMISERVKGGVAIAKNKGLMKGRKPKISKDDIEVVLKMRDKGETFVNIGKKLGVTDSAVHAALCRHNSNTLDLNSEIWKGKRCTV